MCRESDNGYLNGLNGLCTGCGLRIYTLRLLIRKIRSPNPLSESCTSIFQKFKTGYHYFELVLLGDHTVYTFSFEKETSALSRLKVAFENRHFLAWTKLKVFRPLDFQIIESHRTDQYILEELA